MMNSRKHNLRLPASPNNQFIKSPRYSLMETGPSRSIYNSSLTGSPLNHKIAGPLLASTPISYSLSTYMDSKSPGLSERVVQYSNETQECRATHQTKYKMPGVFPVIHLFKKNLPIRKVTPSKVTMQVTMQESAMHTMESMNTSEDITQASRNRMHHDDREASIGTHSVLDALKEISRKRIHSGDQCLQPNNYKRNRRECYIDSPDTKTSNESVSSDSSTMKSAVQPSNVPCFLNDITASLSSTNTSAALQQQKSPPETITQAVEEKIAHSNAETQTDTILLENTKNLLENNNKPELNPSTSPSVEGQKEADMDVEVTDIIVDSIDTTKKNVTENTASFSPVFDEIRADEIRRSKMELLLSALTRNGPKSKPISNGETVKPDIKSDSPPQDIKPVSIMSHHDKPKHDKHVTFVIPEKENIAKESSSSLETNSPAAVINTDNVDTIKLQFGTSPSLSNTSNSESGKDEIVKSASDTIPIRPVLFSTESPSLPKLANSTIKVPEVPFISEPKIQKEVKIEAPKTSLIPPVLNASKLGGFKFDFKKPESTPSKSSISLSPSSGSVKPLFSFANTSSNNNLTTVYSSTVPNMKSSHTPPSSFSGSINFNFSSTPKLNTSLVNTTDTGFIRTVAYPRFSSPPAFNTNTTVTSSTFGTGIFSTGLNTNATVAAVPSSTNAPTPFSNSVPPNTAVAPSFTANQVFNNNSSQESGFKFNTTPNNPLTAASIFSTPTLSSTGLGASNSTFSVPNFNKTTTAAAPASNMFSFVSNTAKEPIVPSSLSGFAVPASTNASVFNPTTVPSLFGKPTTDPPAFGQTVTNTFGQPSVFSGETAQQKPIFDASTTVTNSNPFRSNMFSDATNFKSNTFEFNAPSKTAFSPLNVPQSGMLPSNASQATSPPSTAFGTMFSAGSQPSNNFSSESVFGNNPTATTSANVIGNAPNPPFSSPAFGGNFPPAFNAPAAPTAGTFNIGSGPSGNKPRTHLKARRRT